MAGFFQGITNKINPFLGRGGPAAPPQVPGLAARGLPTETRPVVGPYNQLAHSMAGREPPAVPQLGNPFENINFNLGSGAMPELDAASRYGTGIRGAWNRFSEFTQDPRLQQMAGVYAALNQRPQQPPPPTGLLSPEMMQQYLQQLASSR